MAGTTLHTVSRSPFADRALESCLRVARDGAGVMLIEDAVYAGLPQGAALAGLDRALERLQVYVLGADLEARGIAPERLLAGIRQVDYAGFVHLAVSHARVHAWF